MESKALDTLEILDNWSERLQEHCSPKRSTKRKEFRQTISVYVPDSEENAGEDDDFGMAQGIGRNLSRGGVCFILPHKLPSDRIIVALCHNKHKCVYMESKIVRRRQVHNGYWEYGVQFIDRTIM